MMDFQKSRRLTGVAQIFVQGDELYFNRKSISSGVDIGNNVVLGIACHHLQEVRIFGKVQAYSVMSIAAVVFLYLLPATSPDR